jgi:aspartate carbamoyltransferase regulatory subunit
MEELLLEVINTALSSKDVNETVKIEIRQELKLANRVKVYSKNISQFNMDNINDMFNCQDEKCISTILVKTPPKF